MSAASFKGPPGQRPEPDPNKVPFAERRSALARKSPLKTTRKRRPMKPEAMLDLIHRVMLRDGRCVAIDHDEAMCDGPTAAHHLVPQRVLKAHYSGDELARILEDERNCVALCFCHHELVEKHFLELPEEVLPIGFWGFLNEFGFAAWYEGEQLRRAA